MAKLSRKRLIAVNTVGTLAYGVCLLQWLWLILLSLPLLEQSGLIELLLPAQPAPDPVQPAEISEPSFLIMFIAIAISTAILVLTAYIVAKLPATIGKTGSKITHKSAELSIPIITRHQPIPPKKKRMLTAQLVTVFKALLTILPLISMFLVRNLDTLPVEFSVTVTIAAVLAVLAACLFALQYLLVRLLHVKPSEAW